MQRLFTFYFVLVAQVTKKSEYCDEWQILLWLCAIWDHKRILNLYEIEIRDFAIMSCSLIQRCILLHMDLHATQGLHDQSVLSIGNLGVEGLGTAQEHKYLNRIHILLLWCEFSESRDVSGLKQPAESTHLVALVIYWHIYCVWESILIHCVLTFAFTMHKSVQHPTKIVCRRDGDFQTL